MSTWPTSRTAIKVHAPGRLYVNPLPSGYLEFVFHPGEFRTQHARVWRARRGALISFDDFRAHILLSEQVWCWTCDRPSPACADPPHR